MWECRRHICGIRGFEAKWRWLWTLSLQFAFMSPNQPPFYRSKNLAFRNLLTLTDFRKSSRQGKGDVVGIVLVRYYAPSILDFEACMAIFMPVLPLGLNILSLKIVFNIGRIGWCHDSDSVFVRSSIKSKYSFNIIIHHYPCRYICWCHNSDSVVSISGTGSNQRGIELAGLLGSFIPKYWPVTLQKSEIGKNRK